MGNKRTVVDWSHEETDNPLLADDRNFYKVEKWSRDEQCIERMLWVGNSLDKAREILDAETGTVSSAKLRSSGSLLSPAEEAGPIAQRRPLCRSRTR